MTGEAEFLKLAKERFKQAEEDEREIREEALKDLEFLAGDQWDPKLKADRESKGRPALTFNRLGTFVQQVSNEARENKPQIKFSPARDATKETAEVMEGLARQIQYSSDAQVAYETALEYGAGGSFGYYRFLTDYCDDESFDLELKIVPVLDPFAVYGVLIPSCFGREPKYGFVIEDVPKEEYKARYPDSELTSIGFGDSDSDGWVGTETVRIAEYWHVEETKQTLESPDDSKKTRVIYKNKVKFCKINAVEVLKDSETDWVGSTVPIIPVMGKQLIIKGEARLYSLIRFQRDPQQLINYAKTRIAETLATAPISPFIGVKGQFTGLEKQWSELNSTLRPYVEFNPVDVNGKPADRPQRQTFEPPIQALSEFVAQEIDDLKAISGIFDASLGNKSNEQSGAAIQRRQQQASATNLHFMDNLERAFRKGGNVIAETIPKIYDGARIIRILGEDETSKTVRINEQHMDEAGKQQHYQFTAGKYDVVVSVGRGWSSKRMESFDMMAQIIQGNPQLLMMIGDIFFRNSDTAGADQLADRFQKMLSPQLQDDKEPIPPQAKAAIAQGQQQLQAMHQYAQMVEGELQKLQQEKQAKSLELASREKIAMAEIAAKVTIAEIQTKAQSEAERSEMYKEIWSELHGSAHEVAMQSTQQSHEADQAQLAQQAQQQTQEQQPQQ